MVASRTRLATRNVIATLIVSILIFPLQFINRYYMVRYLGVTYLGITSLYSNILSVLSLADLGIGTAIIFMMYRPLAENNRRKITILMRYYRTIYRIIAIIIFMLGIFVVPFFKIFLHSSINYPHVYIIFFVYLMGTVTSYLFSYNQSLLYADQQNRIYSWIHLVVCYVMMIIQIVTVKLFKGPILYAILYVFTSFVTNLFVSLYVNRRYKLDYKKYREKLSYEELKELFSNVVGNMFLRMSGVIVTGTDSMLLSAFTNVVQVGFYANYLTITNVIQQLMTKVIGASTGSIGNYSIEQDSSEAEKLFYKLQFLNFIILNFACLSIMFLSRDVITIWLGGKYVLPRLDIFLITLSFYFMNYRMLGWNFVAVYGLAKYMKLFSVNEVIINFVASFVFLKFMHLGIAGVVLGTICSTILTVGWQDPYIIFHYGFKAKVLPYFKQYLVCLFAFFLEILILFIFDRTINTTISNTYTHFLMCFFEIIITGILMIVIVFHRTNEFKFMLGLINKIVKRI